MNGREDAEFDPYANSYDETIDAALSGMGVRATYFSRYRARYIAGRLKLATDARVLDYGCGTGNLSVELQALAPGLDLDGYDPSSECIAGIPQSLQGQGAFTSNLAGLGSDYDCILLSMVLHHITPPDRVSVLSALGQRLNEGGCLVIFEHNPLNPLTRRVVDRCPFDRDATLVRPAQAVALSRDAGFERQRLDYLGFFPPPLGGLDRFLAWCPLGVQYVLIVMRIRN
jgi:SAM-dependent methyltransferase